MTKLQKPLDVELREEDDVGRRGEEARGMNVQLRLPTQRTEKRSEKKIQYATLACV